MLILERQIKRALNLKWIKYVYPLREHPNRAPYFFREVSDFENQRLHRRL